MNLTLQVRGLTFEVSASGPDDGEPVLLLHGFPQDNREFDRLVPILNDAGLRTYALNQRGYSPGARPADVDAYRLREAVADAVAVLDELGVERVHVIGHDWGAQVGWLLAANHPERLRTLTAVSVPHPRALLLALRVRPSQKARLAYFEVFRSSRAERLLLARDAAVLRWMLRPLVARRVQAYVDAAREPGRLTGGLNWYRAFTTDQIARTGVITVPTTYVWSDRDGVVGLTAALRTADWVSADYQLWAMRGVSHWVPEEAPRELADAALARIGV
ncbi:epoxide hydrolase [Actinoplanes sp. OR16]|uniref:alpha/beta fold hydrolase n=1 Tax=Actinoplanes sp. OR16 TaxID=946334 RepID=UPI000F708EC0|nr:alpha/beta hydrolase [Actinoplanes sp. OR16]BBH66602.1 epoxide hydrolase [Actinoplanes sp. OR16]